MEREREAAPTLNLIKVLKERDQKEEKKENKIKSGGGGVLTNCVC